MAALATLDAERWSPDANITTFGDFSVVDFAIDSLSPGQGMDMGQFDMGAADSLGA